MTKHAMLIAGALGLIAAGARAQDAAVLLESLEKVERRVNRLEADIQKVRKGSNPQGKGAGTEAQAGESSRSVRLDSLPDRLSSLESRLAALESRGPAGMTAADSRGSDPARGETGEEDLAPRMASLSRDIQALRTELKAAPAIPQVQALPAASVAASAPSAPSLPAAGATVIAPEAPAARQPAPPAPALVLSGNVQVHGERKFTAASHRDNLDLFWGRANIGLDYQDGQLQSKLNVRVFPEGFGFEPLTGVTFDTAGEGSVRTQAEPQAKVQINNAWVRYAFPDLFSVRVGRMEVYEGPSETFGHYIDAGPGGRFLSRKPSSGHNALEFGSQAAGFASTLTLAAADRKVNRGYLRIVERYAHSSGLQAGLGYRVNVFDKWRYPGEELLHRFDASAAWPLRKGWLLFAEAGLIQVKARKEDDLPLLLGLQVPAGPYLDQISLEAEYLSTRKAKEGAKTEDKPILLNLYARRKLLQRLTFEGGVFSDAQRVDPAAVGVGLRATSSLK